LSDHVNDLKKRGNKKQKREETQREEDHTQKKKKRTDFVAGVEDHILLGRNLGAEAVVAVELTEEDKHGREESTHRRDELIEDGNRGQERKKTDAM
jgi:hypothetical protein